MLKKIVVAGILVLAFPIFARPSAAPSPSPDRAEFLLHCRAHRLAARDFRMSEAPHRTDFVPMAALEASQARFSFERFVSALKKDLRNTPDAQVDFTTQHWRLPYDDGRSLLPLDKTITGIFYRGKVHIVDGHHKALSSLYLGAQSIPVAMLGDWSDLEPAEFAVKMEASGYSYLRNYRGARMRIRDLCELVDDGNLQLARFLFRKVDLKVSRDHQRYKILKTSGSAFPILLKINDDIPFFEFEIADALRRSGVDFDPQRTDGDIGKKERKAYLRILLEKAQRGDSRLSQLLLLDRPTRVAKLDVEEIIDSYIAEQGCESLLARSLVP